MEWKFLQEGRESLSKVDMESFCLSGLMFWILIDRINDYGEPLVDSLLIRQQIDY